MNRRLMVVMALFSLCCCGSRELTPEERAKLEPRLIAFLADESGAGELYDMTQRADGTKEYGVVVRCTNPEELRSAGIHVRSVLGDVVTASVTREELRRVISLPSVRWVEQGSKLEIHQ